MTPLIVTQEDGGYAVTHAPSGLRVWPPYRWHLAPTPADAERALTVALAAPVDWSEAPDAIKAQVGASARSLLNRMRLAATPPRRERYPGSTRRRRRPYEAAHKAQVLGEATRADLRDHWRDFFYDLAWREEFYSTTLVRPQRQPCARFVAHRAAWLGVLRRMARRAHTRACRDESVRGFGRITWNAQGRVMVLERYSEGWSYAA